MKIGFIGCGNMAGAMIRGILDKGAAQPQDLIASAKSEKTMERIRTEYKIRAASNEETAKESDVLFLAVKPQFYEEVILQIRDLVKEDALITAIAPGKTLQWLEDIFARPLKLIRAMPNTPAMVGEAMTGICPGERVTQDELSRVRVLFESFGRTAVVPERLMDVVTGVSGSSPAYVFLFIEAMADAAVAEGMPRAQAYEFAAQAVLGSAKMVLESGLHPGALKDMVCSPGGTTIQAVRVLEEKGMRSSVIEAVCACVEKARAM